MWREYVGALRERKDSVEIYFGVRQTTTTAVAATVCVHLLRTEEKERRRIGAYGTGKEREGDYPTIAFFSRLLSDDGGKSQIFSLICSETPSLQGRER